MEEPEILELIDQYLMGRIRPEDLTILKERMAADPAIAELVRESRETFRVIQFEKNRLLREKLKQIDKKGSWKTGFIPGWITYVMLPIIIITGGWYWTNYYYSNTAIAARYAKMPIVDIKKLYNRQGAEGEWKKADSAFRNEEFDLAVNLYATLLEEGNKEEAYLARWKIILSQLALYGPTPNVKDTLGVFANEAPAPWQAQARKLLRLINSTWYTVFINRVQINVSGLKPRLI